MANTVNDVMNVIASPDYGIKNIAGTNQEILAILSGTHNSKNNIHAIVNDVKNLLQKIVDVNTEKKTVKIDNKSTKINHKNIKNILDETKSIRNSIDDLAKILLKQDIKSIKKSIDDLAKTLLKQEGKTSVGVAKLSDKASQKVADAMIKNIDKQNKGGGMSAIVDVFNKLKDISLKDIIFGKMKLNYISKLLKKSKEDLDIDKKDFDNIFKIINATPEMLKSLLKINKKIKKIIKNNIIQKINDILVGKNSLLTLSKSLKKNEKTFSSANIASNNIKELISSLNETMKNLIFTALWAKLISDNTNSIEYILDGVLIPLSTKLSKNKKDIENGGKASKSIEGIASSLNKTMRKLFFASLWTRLVSNKGIVSIGNMINKLISFSKKLSKNEKDIKTGTKVAKNITVLVGNLLITSIFLTVAAVTAIPALLGALFLKLMVNIIIPIAKNLSKNNKHMAKAVGSAIILTAFTGIMAISSLILSYIADIGLNALIGSVVVAGIVLINIYTFKMLKKSQKNIIIGSVMMLLMSISLLIYGIALGKITKATENVTWKQVGIIATTLIMLALATAVMGEPTTATFIMLGSLTMSLMSLGLIVYGTALGKISKATENLKMKQVLLVGGSIAILGLAVGGAGALSILIALGSGALFLLSTALKPFLETLKNLSKATENLKLEDIDIVKSAMWQLGKGVSKMAILSIPIALGSVALGAMGTTLFVFVKTLKMIKDIGGIPQKEVETTLNVMKLVADYFKQNKLNLKVIWSARRYKKIFPPFMYAVVAFSRLSKMKSIPMRLVNQTLFALQAIGDFFKNNKIDRKTIKNAKNYGKMIKPFVKVVSNLNKLKGMGSVPMRLVNQTLNAIKTIADYYTNNPISFKTMLNSWKYTNMMMPFGIIIKRLSKLKEMGNLPMRLVNQTLNAMKTIADYYTNNPISFKTMLNSWKYTTMMMPFGIIIKRLVKLKEMGNLPMRLVNQTLNAMKTIADYYTNNPISRDAIKASWRYTIMLAPFGFTIKQLSKLKKMGNLPMRLVNQTLNAIGSIADFYTSRQLGFFEGIHAMFSASMITGIVKSFGNAVEILQNLKNLRSVPTKNVDSVIDSITRISNYYRNVTHIDNIEEKSEITKFVVDKFITMATEIQNKFSRVKEINQKAVNSIVSSCRSIIFYYTFTRFVLTRKKVKNMNEVVMRFIKTSQYVKNIKFNIGDFMSVKLAVKSMKYIMKFLKRDTLNIFQRRKAYKSISILRYMSSALSGLSNINPLNISSIGESISNTINGVNTVDLSQVEAVTNMFNAFSNINKSENIINKFTESVKEFTTACKDLMDAMNYNTDAINNIDTNESKGSLFDNIKDKITNFVEIESNDNTNKSNSVTITNVDEIAKTIAEKINGTLSVDIPDTQVQLLINGTGGNEWTISRY